MRPLHCSETRLTIERVAAADFLARLRTLPAAVARVLVHVLLHLLERGRGVEAQMQLRVREYALLQHPDDGRETVLVPLCSVALLGRRAARDAGELLLLWRALQAGERAYAWPVAVQPQLDLLGAPGRRDA